jgi:predicted component of type VI protein secretion system
MNDKTSASKERIQLACKALEEALSNFEQDNSAEEIRRLGQLSELKQRLEAIRTQLDDLSQ